MDEYTWKWQTAYRTWNRGEKCVDLRPGVFEGKLCWVVEWFELTGSNSYLVFSRDLDEDAAKREVAESVFEIELRHRDKEMAPLQ